MLEYSEGPSEESWTREHFGEEIEGGGGAVTGILWDLLSECDLCFSSSDLDLLLLLDFFLSLLSSLLGDLRCLGRGGWICGGVLWSLGTLGATSGDNSRGKLSLWYGGDNGLVFLESELCRGFLCGE